MKKFYPFLVLIILVVPSVLGLLNKGFFVSDDGGWMIVRFSAFYEALRSGQIPVRFLPRLFSGYGYPVADFLYPLFMYLGIPLKVIGFSFVTTIKIIFGVSMIFSGVFAFLWLKRLFKTIPSLTGAIIYVFFPYHLWDLYKRGSIGEILALSIVPFILWQIEKKSLFLTSVGLALLILSHNTLALIFLPVIIIYQVIKNIFSLKEVLFSTILSLGLSAFFWIPALYDKQFTVFDKTLVSEFTNYFNWKLGMGLIGFIGLLVFLVSLYLVILKKKNFLFNFFLVLFILSCFLSLPASRMLWKFLPGANLIQFPFRFLSITIVCSSYIVSRFLEQTKAKFVIFFASLIILITFASSLSFLFPSRIQFLPDSFYYTNMDSTTVKNEYLPIWLKTPNPEVKFSKFEILKGKGIIVEETRGTRATALVDLSQNSLIQLNFLYFPGWQVKIDTKLTPISNKTGLIEFQVLSGKHRIDASFVETRERLIADSISILSFIALMIFGFTKKRYV